MHNLNTMSWPQNLFGFEREGDNDFICHFEGGLLLFLNTTHDARNIQDLVTTAGSAWCRGRRWVLSMKEMWSGGCQSWLYHTWGRGTLYCTVLYCTVLYCTVPG